MIGSIVDKYEILEKIGEGGMATVYRGRHVTLGRDVAVKVLHPHLSSRERNRQRFAREAQAIERLDHDHILSILDYSGAEDSNCYIVTEYIDGVTLKELLEERGRFPSEIVAMMGEELVSALSYAHQLGLVHRDLKPENVMVRKDGVIKLMDFGIARFMDESQLTVTGTLVGSPAYMSPEQALEKPVDSRSDLFSLGTLLYHLVTGQLPFSGSNPSIILRNIIENNYVSPDNIHGDIATPLVALIENLLQKDPDDRSLLTSQIANVFQDTLKESNLNVSEPLWSIQSWLADPNGYEERLVDHLAESLLNLGQEKMNAQDHIGAHKIFNRLLSIDDENPEVVDLIAQMYQNDDKQQNSRLWTWFALPLALAGALTLYFVFQSPQTVVTEVSLTNALTDQKGLSFSTPKESVGVVPVPVVENKNEEAIVSEASRNDKIKTTVTPKSDNAKVDKQRNMQKISLSAKSIRLPPVNVKKKEKPIEKVVVKPVAKAKAKVRVIVENKGWANIWINGKQVGRTTDIEPIAVEPGTHELKLTNTYALTHKQEFTVSPGELKNIQVTALQMKPATLLVSKVYSEDCTVIVDGLTWGTLQKLGYKIKINDPSKDHSLLLKCGENVTARNITSLNPGDTQVLEK